MNGKKEPCPVCEEKRRIADEEKLLKEYVASLPEEMRTESEEYARRRAACAECDRRAENLCAECGCFVRARAAKKNMRCPHPAGRKW